MISTEYEVCTRAPGQHDWLIQDGGMNLDAAEALWTHCVEEAAPGEIVALFKTETQMVRQIEKAKEPPA